MIPGVNIIGGKASEASKSLGRVGQSGGSSELGGSLETEPTNKSFQTLKSI